MVSANYKDRKSFNQKYRKENRLKKRIFREEIIENFVEQRKRLIYFLFTLAKEKLETSVFKSFYGG